MVMPRQQQHEFVNNDMRFGSKAYNNYPANKKRKTDDIQEKSFKTNEVTTLQLTQHEQQVKWTIAKSNSNDLTQDINVLRSLNTFSLSSSEDDFVTPRVRQMSKSADKSSVDTLNERLQDVINKSRAVVNSVKNRRNFRVDSFSGVGKEGSPSLASSLLCSESSESNVHNGKNYDIDFSHSKSSKRAMKPRKQAILIPVPAQGPSVSRTKRLSEKTLTLLEKTKTAVIPVTDVKHYLKKKSVLLAKSDESPSTDAVTAALNLPSSNPAEKCKETSDKEQDIPLPGKKGKKKKKEEASEREDKDKSLPVEQDHVNTDSDVTPDLSSSLTPILNQTCEFRQSDNKICGLAAEGRFCTYHERVVAAVELYIKKKVQAGTSSVGDAVSLIENAPEKSNEDSKTSFNFPVPLKRSVSETVTDAGLFHDELDSGVSRPDLSRFKNSKRKIRSRQRSNSCSQSSDNSDCVSPIRNVKVARFKYLKTLSSGPVDVNKSKLPMNLRKLLEKKQISANLPESSVVRERNNSQSESDTDNMERLADDIASNSSELLHAAVEKDKCFESTNMEIKCASTPISSESFNVTSNDTNLKVVSSESSPVDANNLSTRDAEAMKTLFTLPAPIITKCTATKSITSSSLTYKNAVVPSLCPEKSCSNIQKSTQPITTLTQTTASSSEISEASGTQSSITTKSIYSIITKYNNNLITRTEEFRGNTFAKEAEDNHSFSVVTSSNADHELSASSYSSINTTANSISDASSCNKVSISPSTSILNDIATPVVTTQSSATVVTTGDCKTVLTLMDVISDKAITCKESSCLKKIPVALDDVSMTCLKKVKPINVKLLAEEAKSFPKRNAKSNNEVSRKEIVSCSSAVTSVSHSSTVSTPVCTAQVTHTVPSLERTKCSVVEHTIENVPISRTDLKQSHTFKEGSEGEGLHKKVSSVRTSSVKTSTPREKIFGMSTDGISSISFNDVLNHPLNHDPWVKDVTPSLVKETPYSSKESSDKIAVGKDFNVRQCHTNASYHENILASSKEPVTLCISKTSDIILTSSPQESNSVLPSPMQCESTYDTNGVTELERQSCKNLEVSVEDNNKSIQIWLDCLHSEERSYKAKLTEAEQETKDLVQRISDLQGVVANCNSQIRNIAERRKVLLDQLSSKDQAHINTDKVIANCRASPILFENNINVTQEICCNVTQNNTDVAVSKEEARLNSEDSYSSQNLSQNETSTLEIPESVSMKSSHCFVEPTQESTKYGTALCSPPGNCHETTINSSIESIFEDAKLDATQEQSENNSIDSVKVASKKVKNTSNLSEYRSKNMDQAHSHGSSRLEIANSRDVSLFSKKSMKKGKVEDIPVTSCKTIIANIHAPVTCLKADDNYIFVATVKPCKLFACNVQNETPPVSIYHQFKHQINCLEVAPSNNEKVLFVGSKCGMVCAYTLNVWENLFRVRFGSGEVLSMHFNFNILFVGFMSGVINQICPQTFTIGKVMEKVGSHNKKSKGISCMTSNRMNGKDILCTGTKHGKIFARTIDGNLICEMKNGFGKSNSVLNIQIVGPNLYAISQLRRLDCFDCLTGIRMHTVDLQVTHFNCPNSIAFTDTHIYTVNRSNYINCQDLLSGIHKKISIKTETAEMQVGLICSYKDQLFALCEDRNLRQVPISKDFGSFTREDFARQFPFVRQRGKWRKDLPNVCPYCGTNFPSADMLRLHQFRNTCKLCEGCFSFRTKDRSGYLKAHYQLFHKS